jgi:hypothetical protein
MKIKNRSASVVGYTIPEANIRRRFAPGEIKDIPKEEIEKLLYQPGGRELFMDDLQASSALLRELGLPEQEPEYFYSHEDIKKIMVSGSLDEFLDLLDFATQGGISIIKDYAIKLPLADMNKIEALKKATGFDAGKAIVNAKAVEKEINGEVQSTSEARKRRVEPAAIDNKYKVIE